MRMCAFTLKGATRRSERAGERKNVRSDQEVRILGSHRMPINTVGGDGNFRYQICAGECDSLRRKSTKGDATDHPVLFPDLPTVQEQAELLSLSFCRHRRSQSHAESLCPRALDTLPRFRPCARSAMEIVALGRRAIEADLQC